MQLRVANHETSLPNQLGLVALGLGGFEASQKIPAVYIPLFEESLRVQHQMACSGLADCPAAGSAPKTPRIGKVRCRNERVQSFVGNKHI